MLDASRGVSFIDVSGALVSHLTALTLHSRNMSLSDRDAHCFSVALTALISKLWMETLCNGIYSATLTGPLLLCKIHLKISAQHIVRVKPEIKSKQVNEHRQISLHKLT